MNCLISLILCSFSAAVMLTLLIAWAIRRAPLAGLRYFYALMMAHLMVISMEIIICASELSSVPEAVGPYSILEYLFACTDIVCLGIFLRSYTGSIRRKPYALDIAVYGILAVSAFLWVYGMGDGWFMYVGPDGFRAWTEMFPSMLSGPFLALLLVYFLALRHMDRFSRQMRAAWVMMMVFPICGAAAEAFLGIRIMYPVLTIALVFLQSQLFAEREGLIARRQNETAVSQLDPHFIYNCLANIMHASGPEGEEAREMLALFSGYLRYCFRSLSGGGEVPAYEEFCHTRNYIALEKKRFPYIAEEYSIEADCFGVPPLVIQPLIKAAVNRGMYDRPGTVLHIRISSSEEGREYVMRIEDDAPSSMPDGGVFPADGGDGGISAAGERLQATCSGTVETSHGEGRGTVVTIRIPKRKDNR